MLSSRFGRSLKTLRFAVLAATLAGLVISGPAKATSAARTINERDRVVLRNNVHPFARREFELRRSDPELPMERMILALHLRPGGQAKLEQLITAQHNPSSPLFHKWLTPEQFGARFGLEDEDLAAVTHWLTGHGFAIDEVAKGRGWINFSGTAAQ
ncbi:MAG TPA: protease pro-enzyme activation domain-containing protein, partial [Thermoanaerobaculia bacterium]|nr:protease pro-enzyme activation domain-containing protein [Thermoanaerobaculia bacterium]